MKKIIVSIFVAVLAAIPLGSKVSAQSQIFTANEILSTDVNIGLPFLTTISCSNNGNESLIDFEAYFDITVVRDGSEINVVTSMTDAVISFNSDILETDLEITNDSYKVTPTNAISIHGGDDVFIAAEIGFGSGLQLLDEVRVEFFCTAMPNGQTVDTTIQTFTTSVLPEEGDPGVIYRFYNASVNSHFYTMDFNEVIYLITENPNWNFEGEVYKAIPTATGGGCTTDQNAIYRFFNEGTTKHFYTDSPEEKDYLISTNPSWDYEGTAYCVPKQASPTDVPLYQFYSDVYGGHFYTIDPIERDWVISALANVYRYEGPVFFVSPL